MEQLISLVVEKTGLSEDAAKNAVEVVISFIKEKLPQPVAGQIDGLLSGETDVEEGGIGGALKGMLGG